MTARQEEFIKALAKFLAGDPATKSIELELGKQWAKEWAALRQTTPVGGYCSVADAEVVLKEWLFP